MAAIETFVLGTNYLIMDEAASDIMNIAAEMMQMKANGVKGEAVR